MSKKIKQFIKDNIILIFVFFILFNFNYWYPFLFYFKLYSYLIKYFCKFDDNFLCIKYIK